MERWRLRALSIASLVVARLIAAAVDGDDLTAAADESTVFVLMSCRPRPALADAVVALLVGAVDLREADMDVGDLRATKRYGLNSESL